MTEDGAFRIPLHVLYREVEGQMVLLDIEREEYFGLNEVGADIVAAVTTGGVEEALEVLGHRYDVDESTLRGDVDELLRELVAAGLLAPADAR